MQVPKKSMKNHEATASRFANEKKPLQYIPIAHGSMVPANVILWLGEMCTQTYCKRKMKSNQIIITQNDFSFRINSPRHPSKVGFCEVDLTSNVTLILS